MELLWRCAIGELPLVEIVIVYGLHAIFVQYINLCRASVLRLGDASHCFLREVEYSKGRHPLV